MIDSRTREIRAILIGWVRYIEGVCIASEGLSNMQFQGLNNGASAARIRGIKELRKQYIVPKRLIRDSEEFGRILRTMGRISYLFSSPNAMVSLCRPFLFLVPPVLVTIEICKGNQLLCCFHTAKTLFAKLRLRYVIRKLHLLLPSEVQEIPVTSEPYVVEAVDVEEQLQKPDEVENLLESENSEADDNKIAEGDDGAEEDNGTQIIDPEGKKVAKEATNRRKKVDRSRKNRNEKGHGGTG